MTGRREALKYEVTISLQNARRHENRNLAFNGFER